MTCSIIGPGLVGSFLGAASMATRARGRHDRGVCETVLLPCGIRRWQPAPTVDASGPTVVATRVHQTPWKTLPPDSIAAQNGLGQPIPVVVCFMAIDRRADGVITSVGVTPRLVVGPVSATWQPVLAAWRAAGLIVEEVADIRPAQWEKTILNATVGPLCLATGKDMAAVWNDPDLRRLVLAATGEGESIALGQGVTIAPDLSERAGVFFDRVSSHRPSIMRDAGELPSILGHLCASARVPIPALAEIARLVSAHVRPA